MIAGILSGMHGSSAFPVGGGSTNPSATMAVSARCVCAVPENDGSPLILLFGNMGVCILAGSGRITGYAGMSLASENVRFS
jgi:hypothetical protein